ncbi:MAG: bifunctional riboflavin kinase/FAD synthetase [Candidatus Saganbacteria bacterium]|nr:bifunctional riboflavin kinase/FAD synthetase [Candidatus Saganbacteria bacterium]
MKTTKDLKNFKESSSVVAIGTFDGFHLGHKKVIASAVAFAKAKKLPSVVLTFDPHPQKALHPGRQIKMLSTADERACLVEALSPDHFVVAKFDRNFSSMNYKKFVNDILLKKLKVKHIFVGKDYVFGRGKEGNLSKLKKLGKEFGFSVTGVTDKKEAGRVVKSTLIRHLIEKGEFSHALNLLGHPYLICGKVISGRGRGALLGYPTANVAVGPEKLVPCDGVYACHVMINGKKYKGAVNIGRRPTFIEKDRTIEVFILNFRSDIRGKKLRLFLEKRLRSEKKFNNVKTLIRAIGHDAKIAERILV